MDIHPQYQALEELTEDARTAEQLSILRSWYDEIVKAAKKQNQTVPNMSFMDGVLEFGDTIMIFPIEKKLFDPSGSKSYDEIEEENKKPQKQATTNPDNATQEILRQQRTRFIGRIATQWVKDGYRVRIHRGFRAWRDTDVFDIVTRQCGSGEDAIAECEKPGHASFLLRANEGNWRESFIESKQKFTTKTKQGIGFRLIHRGNPQKWEEKAIKYFREGNSYGKNK